MKKFISIIILAIFITSMTIPAIYAADTDEEVKINDKNLKEALLQDYDYDKNGKITKSDMEQIKDFNPMDSIEDFTGLEYAVNAESVDVSIMGKKNISSIFKLSNLKSLRINDWYLGEDGTDVDLNGIENLTKLESLDLHIESVNVLNLEKIEKLTNLKDLKLEIENDDLTFINNLTNLETLRCELPTLYSNNAVNYRFDKLKKLKELIFTADEINLSDIKDLTSIESVNIKLNLDDSQDLSEVGALTNLQKLSVSNADVLTNLKAINNMGNITKLSLGYNNLNNVKELDTITSDTLELSISNSGALGSGEFYSDEDEKNLLEKINNINIENYNFSVASYNRRIKNIEKSKSKTYSFKEITSILDKAFDSSSKLYMPDATIEASYNSNATIDKANKTITIKAGDSAGEKQFTINVRNSQKTLSFLISYNITDGGDKNKEINIPDENLKNRLLRGYDLDLDEKITEFDALNTSTLSLSNSNISDLTGLENYSNLTSLWINSNKIKDLTPIMELSKLKSINASKNLITDLSCLKNRKFANLSLLNLSENFIDFYNDSENLNIYLEELGKDKNYGINGETLSYYSTSQKYGNPEDFDKEVKFGDEKIKNKLIELGADTNNDGKLTARELYESTYVDSPSTMRQNTAPKQKIAKLDLSNMGISDLSGLEYMGELEELDLSNNNISNIEPICHLMNLKKLNLSNNNISDITGLPKYAGNSPYYNTTLLTKDCYFELNLSNNNITDISSLKNCLRYVNTECIPWSATGSKPERKLKLNFSGNKIQSIEVVNEFKNLLWLDLSDNEIKDITALKNYDFVVGYWTDEVKDLELFEGIDLSNNDIDLNAEGTKNAKSHFDEQNVKLILDNQGTEQKPTEEIMNFKDVSQNVWYYNSVKYCYDNGIIMGTTDTTFSPNTNITRGNLVTILWRMEGNPKVSGNIAFPDVKETDYYYEAVKWAEKSGVVHGYDTGKFGPNNNISREQLATILNNYAKYKKKDTSDKADLTKFTDNKKISSYAREGVAWAVAKKVISGKVNGTMVDPQGKASRAEAAAMIQNYCNYVGR